MIGGTRTAGAIDVAALARDVAVEPLRSATWCLGPPIRCGSPPRPRGRHLWAAPGRQHAHHRLPPGVVAERKLKNNLEK